MPQTLELQNVLLLSMSRFNALRAVITFHVLEGLNKSFIDKVGVPIKGWRFVYISRKFLQLFQGTFSSFLHHILRHVDLVHRVIDGVNDTFEDVKVLLFLVKIYVLINIRDGFLLREKVERANFLWRVFDSFQKFVFG